MVYGLVHFRSMTLVNEVERTGTATGSSVYQTHGGIRRMGGRPEISLVAAQNLGGNEVR